MPSILTFAAGCLPGIGSRWHPTAAVRHLHLQSVVPDFHPPRRPAHLLHHAVVVDLRPSSSTSAMCILRFLQIHICTSSISTPIRPNIYLRGGYALSNTQHSSHNGACLKLIAPGSGTSCRRFEIGPRRVLLAIVGYRPEVGWVKGHLP